MEVPYSQACERNAPHILAQLRTYLSPQTNGQLLEIGSGTGQHAVFLAPHFPSLMWQTSDLPENHQGIQQWIEQTLPQGNVLPPITFDCQKDQAPPNHYQYVYTANTFHIMPWEVVLKCAQQISQTLKMHGHFFLYGPFNQHGDYTAPSNQEFDRYLKAKDPNMGIRDGEKIQEFFCDLGLELKSQRKMPANNQFLVFKKTNQKK